MPQPDERQLRTLGEIRDLEAGLRRHVNREGAEECVERDWAERVPEGYRLTATGRAVLDAQR